jgi:Xaa-Pro dipeptidase
MTEYAEHIAAKQAIYDKALVAGGFDYAIVPAGSLTYPFADDLDYPFRANPYFSEWVPVQDRPDSYLLLRQGDRPQLLLSSAGGFWDSPPSAVPEEVQKALQVVFYDGTPDLKSRLAVSGLGVWIGPDDGVGEKLAGLACNVEGVLAVIDYHRAYKTAYEMQCLREASRRAAVGHDAARRAFLDGGSELDIHLAYLAATRTADEELPYRSIIALNENAATLHHMVRQKEPPERARSFLIDAGMSERGYAADISRTHVFDHQSAEAFSALVRDMDDGQQHLVAEISKCGSFPALHESAHRLVAELLVRHGLVHCGLEEAMASGVSQVFFPHGLGHLLGIQVHDRGGHLASTDGTVQPPPDHYPHLRFTRELQTGMVFTVEPGLYFIPPLIAGFDKQSLLNHRLIDELTPYGGIRIEDNVVIHDRGVENFTRDAFAALAN